MDVCVGCTTLAKKIETTTRTWRRRVISRACTRLCLACVAVSIFLARVVKAVWGVGGMTHERLECRWKFHDFFTNFQTDSFYCVLIACWHVRIHFFCIQPHWRS